MVYMYLVVDDWYLVKHFTRLHYTSLLPMSLEKSPNNQRVGWRGRWIDSICTMTVVCFSRKY